MPTLYTPTHVNEYTSKLLNARVQGVTTTVAAGTSGNLDWECPDDRIMTGGYLLAKGSVWGDTATLQVVDINGVLAPAGTILNEFVTNLCIHEDTQLKIALEMPYPAKIFQGLFLRVRYTSSGLADVRVGINYLLHKILS